MEFDVFDGLVVNVVVKLVVFINVGVDIDGIFWNGDVCIYQWVWILSVVCYEVLVFVVYFDVVEGFEVGVLYVYVFEDNGY